MTEQSIDQLVEQKFKEKMSAIGRKGGSQTSHRKLKSSQRNIRKAQKAVRQLARKKS